MYNLKVLKKLTLDDGTLYLPGHDSMQLSAFEAALLLHKYPQHFSPADDMTKSFAENKENLEHLAKAAEGESE
jgi:glyoxylase-like metal-dependent hydrolase (beta-lactamase superfamily II)